MTMNRAAPLLLALLAPLALAACQKAQEASSSGTGAPAATAPAATAQAEPQTPGGRLILPVIAGRPAAAYIAWHNGTGAPATIKGVTIAAATSADMHETRGGAMLPLAGVTLAPGQDAHFMPGGRHVMVYGLPASVKPGDAVAYTLNLSDGRKLPGQFEAQKAGAAPAMPMKGMSM